MEMKGQHTHPNTHPHTHTHTHTPTHTHPHTQILTNSDGEVTLAPDAEVEQDEAVEVLLEERAGCGA